MQGSLGIRVSDKEGSLLGCPHGRDNSHKSNYVGVYVGTPIYSCAIITLHKP